VLEALTNFMAYANNTRYKSVVYSAFRNIDELLLAYAPAPSNDDLQWYALSYLRYYELFKDEKFLKEAKIIYDYVWDQGWDPYVKHMPPPPGCYSYQKSLWEGEKQCVPQSNTTCGCPTCRRCLTVIVPPPEKPGSPPEGCYQYKGFNWKGKNCTADP